MNRFFQNLFAFILLACALAILAAPYWLVIEFPDSGEWLASIAAKTTPWLVIFLTLAVFYDGINELFRSAGRAFDRLRKLSAGSTAAELEPHQTPPEIGRVEQVGLLDISTLNRYFLLYILSQIFGSQFEFLRSLKDGPKGIKDAVPFYEKFKEQLDIEGEFTFDSWLGFLKSNSLLTQPAQQDLLELTQPGRVFVDAVEALKPPPQLKF